ncbi:hypothetical protein NFI96_003480 [Prochilodus magdalenae]|nr:hypothetical protein NFI96_003480 [Prochilodus magdalenae]
MAFYTQCLQDLPKVTINDVQHIIQASSTAPRSKREKGFKMYISSYIDNYEAVAGSIFVAMATAPISTRCTSLWPAVTVICRAIKRQMLDGQVALAEA